MHNKEDNAFQNQLKVMFLTPSLEKTNNKFKKLRQYKIN